MIGRNRPTAIGVATRLETPTLSFEVTPKRRFVSSIAHAHLASRAATDRRIWRNDLRLSRYRRIVRRAPHCHTRSTPTAEARKVAADAPRTAVLACSGVT